MPGDIAQPTGVSCPPHWPVLRVLFPVRQLYFPQKNPVCVTMRVTGRLVLFDSRGTGVSALEAREQCNANSDRDTYRIFSLVQRCIFSLELYPIDLPITTLALHAARWEGVLHSGFSTILVPAATNAIAT